MRTIDYTARFKRDYKRELRGQHRKTLDEDFNAVLTFLLSDTPLPAKYNDHALTGEWKNHRDCHVKPDLVLIYCKLNEKILELDRIGSHSELEL
jgi:mRNA interferase YafQ